MTEALNPEKKIYFGIVDESDTKISKFFIVNGIEVKDDGSIKYSIICTTDNNKDAEMICNALNVVALVVDTSRTEAVYLVPPEDGP